MEQVRHGSATTTHAVRPAMQRAQCVPVNGFTLRWLSVLIALSATSCHDVIK
jgi:hypothetical protein